MIPEIHDANPKTWLTPFRSNSIFYIFKMGLFYHGLGLLLWYAGSFFATSAIPSYEAPHFPVSVSLALSSGLLEEAVFFGIPYYMLAGNPLLLLGSGAIWSVLHLYGSGALSIESLSYGGFFFAVPHVFFSIRTWISRKGWFAILFHSAWNTAFLMSYCAWGFRQCGAFNSVMDVANVVVAVSVGVILYITHKNKERRINRFFYLVPVVVIIATIAYTFSI